MMAGRFGRPKSSAGRPESRTESRAGERPKTGGGKRPKTGGKRPKTGGGERPKTGSGDRPKSVIEQRMEGRIEALQEERERKKKEKEEKESEPSASCGMKMKALWMLFKMSFLPKVFIIVGAVLLTFGIGMLIMGYATDKFAMGKTLGLALAGGGLIALVIGLLAMKSASAEKHKVQDKNQDDIEKAKHGYTDDKNHNDKFSNGANILRLENEDSDRGFNSDNDQYNKSVKKSTGRRKSKDTYTALEGNDIPMVTVNRPRTLPPLAAKEEKKKSIKKKKKKKQHMEEIGPDGTYTLEDDDNEVPFTISGNDDDVLRTSRKSVEFSDYNARYQLE